MQRIPQHGRAILVLDRNQAEEDCEESVLGTGTDRELWVALKRLSIATNLCARTSVSAVLCVRYAASCTYFCVPVNCFTGEKKREERGARTRILCFDHTLRIFDRQAILLRVFSDQISIELHSYGTLADVCTSHATSSTLQIEFTLYQVLTYIATTLHKRPLPHHML